MRPGRPSPASRTFKLDAANRNHADSSLELAPHFRPRRSDARLEVPGGLLAGRDGSRALRRQPELPLAHQHDQDDDADRRPDQEVQRHRVQRRRDLVDGAEDGQPGDGQRQDDRDGQRRRRSPVPHRPRIDASASGGVDHRERQRPVLRQPEEEREVLRDGPLAAGCRATAGPRGSRPPSARPTVTMATTGVPYRRDTPANAPGIRRSRASENMSRVHATDAPMPTAARSRISRMFMRSNMNCDAVPSLPLFGQREHEHAARRCRPRLHVQVEPDRLRVRGDHEVHGRRCRPTTGPRAGCCASAPRLLGQVRRRLEPHEQQDRVQHAVEEVPDAVRRARLNGFALLLRRLEDRRRSGRPSRWSRRPAPAPSWTARGDADAEVQDAEQDGRCRSRLEHPVRNVPLVRLQPVLESTPPISSGMADRQHQQAPLVDPPEHESRAARRSRPRCSRTGRRRRGSASANCAISHPSAPMPTAATMMASGVASPAPLPALLAPTTVISSRIAPNTGPMNPTDWAMTSMKPSPAFPSFSYSTFSSAMCSPRPRARTAPRGPNAMRSRCPDSILRGRSERDSGAG